MMKKALAARSLLGIAAIVATIVSCGGPFDLQGLLDGPDGLSLSLAPAAGVVAANQTVDFSVTGGYPPYVFSVTGGGTIEGTVYRAPGASGTATIQVTDAVGATASARLEIDASTVSVGINPSAQTVYTGGLISFSAFGGTGPYSFSLHQNQSGAPAIIGTGYEAGRFPGTDVVRVTDLADMSTADATVAVVAKPLSLSPGSISIHTGQSFTFSVIGDDGPFGFSIALNNTGGTVDSGSGLYQAGGTPGTDTIRMVDAYDGREVTATVTAVDPAIVTNVDYAPGPITNVAGAFQTGSAFTADVTISNVGTANGTRDVAWKVYASVDGTIGGADFVVAGGTIAGGLTGGGSQLVGIGGTWPLIAGSYYLLIEARAEDDLTAANDVNQSAAAFAVTHPVSISPTTATVYTGQEIQFAATGRAPFAFTIDMNGSGGSIDAFGLYIAGPNSGTDTVRVTDADAASALATVTVQTTPLPTAIDYRVNSVTVTGGGTTTGSVVNGEFELENAGSGAGAHAVSWDVFASLDASFGAGDTLVASGTQTALAASALVAVPFAGTWPFDAGDYFLIARVSAVDDTLTANNTGVTATAHTISVPPPADVDYYVSVPPPGGNYTVGTAMNESFTIRNGGTDPGGATVAWSVFLSSDPNLSGDDLLVSSGSIVGGLPAGGTALRSATGSWPATSGLRYLIVSLDISDANVGNNVATSLAYFIEDPAILDYVPSDLTTNFTTVTTGSPISETFSVTNIGGVNGADDIVWRAYASLDATPNPGEVVGTGTLAPLPAGGSQVGISAVGNWPSVPGDYWLIIEVDALDEANRNDFIVSDKRFRVSDPPDYRFNAVSFPVAGFGGNWNEPLTDASTGHGGAAAHSFEIIEVNNAPGQQSIQWGLYASDNGILDAGDDLLVQGLLPALGAGGTSGTITIPDTVALPATPGRYYYILKLAAGDDSNPANDTFAVGPINVWSTVIASTSDVNNPSTHDHFLQLNAGDTVTITGQINVGESYDVYPVLTGSSVTGLQILLTWATGRDTLDMYFYSAANPQIPIASSTETSVDREPVAGTFDVTGLTPVSSYLIEVYAWDTTAARQYPGEPYTLTISAPP